MVKLTERQIKILSKAHALSGQSYAHEIIEKGILPMAAMPILASKCAEKSVHISASRKAGAEFEDLLYIALEIK